MLRRCFYLCFIAALAAADQLPADHHCAGIVPDVQGAYSQASALSKIAIDLLPMYLTYDCALSLRNFICLSTFSEYVVPSPKKVCTDVCNTVWRDCGELFEQAKDEPALSQITDNLDTCEDTGDCLPGNYDVFFEEDLPSCPSPLVVPDRDDPDIPVTGTGCAIPCLTPTLTREEWELFIDILKVFSSIGFASAFYMCVKGGIDTVNCNDPNKRPAHLYVWMFSLGCALSSFGNIMVVANGVEETLCLGNATTDTYNPVCVAQGYMHAFGCMFAAVWALCQCFEIYMRVVRRASKVTLDACRKYYPYILVPWAIWPVVFAVATNDIGFELELSMPSCFYFPYTNKWVQYVAWYGPFLLAAVLCFVFMAQTIYEINKVLMRSVGTTTVVETTTTGGEKSRQFMKILKFNARPLLFVFVFALSSAYVSMVRISLSSLEDKYRDSTEEFVRCLLKKSSESGGDTSACGAAPEFRAPFPVLALCSILMSAFGMIPMVVFGAECSRLTAYIPASWKSRFNELFSSRTSKAPFDKSGSSGGKTSQQPHGIEMGKLRLDGSGSSDEHSNRSASGASARASGSLAVSEPEEDTNNNNNNTTNNTTFAL